MIARLIYPFKSITIRPDIAELNDNNSRNYLEMTFTEKWVRYSLVPMHHSSPSNCRVDVKFDIRDLDNKQNYKHDYMRLCDAITKVKPIVYDDIVEDDHIGHCVKAEYTNGKQFSCDDCMEDDSLKEIQEIVSFYMPELFRKILTIR